MPEIMTAGSPPLPSTAYEEPFWAAGKALVAGVDEVGRGPLAGPVFAAAVILNCAQRPPWLSELRDSKELPAKQRERLSAVIRAEAVAFGLGWSSVAEIDAHGIGPANQTAMARAIAGLGRAPDHVLIDGPSTIPVALPQRAIVDGDALCSSIAAASIVAKVARDAVMRAVGYLYPAYDFGRNKGYATRDHLARLAEHGPCVYHRRSWLAVSRFDRSAAAATVTVDAAR